MTKPSTWPSAPKPLATDHPTKAREDVAYQRACDECWRWVEARRGPSTRDIISDAEVARVHGNANFGSRAPREVIATGVRKEAQGWSHGSTINAILQEHGLVHRGQRMRPKSGLSNKGLEYLRALIREEQWSQGDE